MNEYKSLLKYKLIKNFFNNNTNKNAFIPSKIRSLKHLYTNTSYNGIGLGNSNKTHYEKLKNALINNTFGIVSNKNTPLNNNANSKKPIYPAKNIFKKFNNISFNNKKSKNKRIKNFKTFISNNNSYVYSQNNSLSNSNKLVKNKKSFPLRKDINKNNETSIYKNFSLDISLKHKIHSRNTYDNSFNKENQNRKLVGYKITNNNSNYRIVKISENFEKTVSEYKRKKYEKPQKNLSDISKMIEFGNKINVNKKLVKYITYLNNRNSKDFSKSNKKIFHTFTNAKNNFNCKNYGIKNVKGYSIDLFNKKFYPQRPKKNKSGDFLNCLSVSYKTNLNSRNHKAKESNEKKKTNLISKKKGMLLNKNNLGMKKHLTFNLKNKKESKNEKPNKVKVNNKLNKNEKSKNYNNSINNNKNILHAHIKNITLNNFKKICKNLKINKMKNMKGKDKNSVFSTKSTYKFVKTEYNENDDNFKKINEKDNPILNTKISNEIFGRNSYKILKDSYNKDEDKIMKQNFEINQLSKEIDKEKDLDETESPLSSKVETINNDINDSALTYNQVKDIIIYYDMDDLNVIRKNYLFKKNSEKFFYLNSINNYASRFFEK